MNLLFDSHPNPLVQMLVEKHNGRFAILKEEIIRREFKREQIALEQRRQIILKKEFNNECCK